MIFKVFIRRIWHFCKNLFKFSLGSTTVGTRNTNSHYWIKCCISVQEFLEINLNLFFLTNLQSCDPTDFLSMGPLGLVDLSSRFLSLSIASSNLTKERARGNRGLLEGVFVKGPCCEMGLSHDFPDETWWKPQGCCRIAPSTEAMLCLKKDLKLRFKWCPPPQVICMFSPNSFLLSQGHHLAPLARSGGLGYPHLPCSACPCSRRVF